jgi:hypothetical protein
MGGVTVTFSVSGANTAGGTAVTNSAGNATFQYAGTHTGNDTVTATAGSASDTATITWNPKPTSPTTLSINPDRPLRAKAGSRLVFHGNLVAADPSACDTSNEVIKLRFKGDHSKHFVFVDSVLTGNRGGNWRIVVHLGDSPVFNHSGTFQARFVPQTGDTCLKSSSDKVHLHVV